MISEKGINLITRNEIEQLKSNPTNQVHLLRHYSEISNTYADKLLGKYYEYYDYRVNKYKKAKVNEKVIQKCLAAKGSKFKHNLDGIENPDNLIEFIKTQMLKKRLYWRLKNGNKFAQFNIKQRNFIGDDILIDINQINKDNIHKIKTEKRGSMAGDSNTIIKTIKGLKPKPTKNLCVEIVWRNDMNFPTLTAYPGILAPDFPNKSQNAKEKIKSQNFWNNHIFII